MHQWFSGRVRGEARMQEIKEGARRVRERAQGHLDFFLLVGDVGNEFVEQYSHHHIQQHHACPFVIQCYLQLSIVTSRSLVIWIDSHELVSVGLQKPVSI
jgi:uncharacterized membrane protein YsdA (DUF1294 family)